MYRLEISPHAKKQLKKIKKNYQPIIKLAFKELQQEPFLVGKGLSRELTGRFSLKIGTYRIIYKVDNKDKIVTVLTIGPRATVYK